MRQAPTDSLSAGRTPILISHAGEGATSDTQSTLFKALKAHYRGRPLNRLRLWMAFREGLVAGSTAENTTRGRSFLFFALGVFAGTGLEHAFTLKVPENGLVAINVPLDPLRLGALSTRTTHPFYIARWNDALAALRLVSGSRTPTGIGRRARWSRLAPTARCSVGSRRRLSHVRRRARAVGKDSARSTAATACPASSAAHHW